MTDNEICKNCNKAKVSSKSGSITQWVSVCSCDAKNLADIPDTTINLCVKCGKRIGEGRQGSITQFVFRSELCACAKPLPIQQETSKQADKTNYEQSTDAEVIDEELVKELDPGSFPLDRYSPYKLLGQGGSGSVYSCLDTVLKKKVAVKILNKLTDEQLIAFQEEAKATSRLNHHSIVKVRDFGATKSGAPYMVLEYITGKSLETCLNEGEIFSPKKCIYIMRALCDALSYAHGQGVYHRDIKPSNILLSSIQSENPVVTVIDFGVAHITELSGKVTDIEGVKIAGTPRYMCPDLVNGKAFTQRSEIYSVGCVIYECLTGFPPFDGNSASEILYKKANENVPEFHGLSDEPEEIRLTNILTKCLDKDPEKRYHSMDQVKESLESPQEEHKAYSSGESKTEEKKKIALTPLPILIVICLGLLGISSTAYIWYQNNQQSKEKSAKSKKRKTKKTTLNDDKTPLLSPFLHPETRKIWTVRKTQNNTTAASIYGAKIDADVLETFPENVNMLWFVQCRIVDPKTMHKLGAKKEIEVVFIHHCYLADGAFKSLIKGLETHKNIKFINIVESNITDANIKLLNKMPYLEAITMHGDFFTDRSVKLLKDNNFVDVQIQYSKVSDRSINEFVKWKKMKYLSIAHNLITPKGISKFKRLRSDCKISLVKTDEQLVGPDDYGQLIKVLDK